MEFVQSLIGKIFNVDVVFIVAVITALNVVIVALAKFFEVIKDKTETSLDNKIAKWLGLVSGLILKILNVISARGK